VGALKGLELGGGNDLKTLANLAKRKEVVEVMVQTPRRVVLIVSS